MRERACWEGYFEDKGRGWPGVPGPVAQVTDLYPQMERRGLGGGGKGRGRSKWRGRQAVARGKKPGRAEVLSESEGSRIPWTGKAQEG